MSPLEGSPFQAYLYAYPHKTAYRPFSPPKRLDEVWSEEAKHALFLYAHVPFCEMRCGFCNLFTEAKPHEEKVRDWLDALVRQAAAVRSALGETSYARFAIGGGTPTLLDVASLERVLDLVERGMGAALPSIPASVEVSPETVDRDKLGLLRARGIDRISLGVQSFDEREARAAGRPQSRARVEAALDSIRAHGFPVLNVDLIYGLEGQTEASFLASLRAALRYSPEEIYLYPLYVRPLTGLGRSKRAWDDQRLALYRVGRELLLSEGFSQVSMRMFQRGRATEGPVYCVQDDGMVGLGVGARSYTRRVHHGSDYAVNARAVESVIDTYVARDDFHLVDHGFELDDDEQRRRWVLLGLFGEGVDRAVYRERFGGDVMEHLPELAEVVQLALAIDDGARIALTPLGVERSDAIGPFLVSRAVRARMEAYEVR